jgi:phospholipid/cholesterol/gamma-HCH transport system substrate-binding protein
MPSYTKTEFRVGILVIIAAGILGFGVFWIAGPKILTSTYTIYVDFDYVKGLSPGSMVKCAGVNIGWVEDMQQKPERHKVQITAKIYEDAILFKGAEARVQSSGIVGDFYLETTFGDPDAGKLKDGDVILGVTTYSLEDVTEELYSTLASLQQFVGDEQVKGNFTTILANTADVTESMKHILGEVREATAAGLNITDAITDFREGAAEFRSLAQASNSMVRGASPGINKVVEDLSATTARIRTELVRDAGEILAEMRGVAEDLRKVSGNANDIVTGNRERIDTIVTNMEKGSASLSSVAERMDRILLEYEESEGPLKRLITDEEWGEDVDEILGGAKSTVNTIRGLTRPGFYYEFRAFEGNAERYADNYLRNDLGIAWNFTENDRVTVGVNDLGGENDFELTYGHRFWDTLTPYAGVIESEAAVGVDVKVWWDWLHLQAEGIGLTDSEKNRLDLYSQFKFHKYGSILFGVEDAFDENYINGGFRLEI